MVDKLNSIGRTGLAAQLSRALRANKPAGGDKGTVAQRNADSESGNAQATLDQRVARQIAAIDAGDPRRRQKAFRVFIEAQILNEFGASLNNDAAFQQLVDDVVSGMEGDQGLRHEIDEVTQGLLSKA